MRYLYILFLFIFALTSSAADNEVPNIKSENLNNQKVELYELLERGPVVLDFWATWCKPCLKAFPKLNELHKKYADKGLTVLGVNEDGNRNQSKIKPFAKSLGIKFESIIDENNEIMRKFQVNNLPATVLISPDGKIISKSFGYSPDKFKKLEGQIIQLLKEYGKEIPADNDKN